MRQIIIWRKIKVLVRVGGMTYALDICKFQRVVRILRSMYCIEFFAWRNLYGWVELVKNISFDLHVLLWIMARWPQNCTFIFGLWKKKEEKNCPTLPLIHNWLFTNDKVFIGTMPLILNWWQVILALFQLWFCFFLLEKWTNKLQLSSSCKIKFWFCIFFICRMRYSLHEIFINFIYILMQYEIKIEFER